MKKWKRLMVLLLAVLIAAGMKTTVLASSLAGTATGSITIEGTNDETLAGRSFSAYQILALELTGTDDDTTGEDERGYVYTVPEEWKAFYLEYFVDGSGNALLDENSGQFSYDVYEMIAGLSETELYALGVAAVDYATSQSPEIQTKGTADNSNYNSTENTMTISNLPLGYYVVSETSSSSDYTLSAVMIGSTNNDITVTLKAETPTLEKDIITVEADEQNNIDEETSDYNNASIGDVEKYKLTSFVPAMTGYTKYYYIANDTFSEGLTFNGDVEVTIDYSEVVDTVTTANDGSTSTISGTPETGEVKLTGYYRMYTKDSSADTYSWKYYSDIDGTTEVDLDKVTSTLYFYVTILVEEDQGESDNVKKDSDGNAIPTGEIEIVFHDFLQYRTDPENVTEGTDADGNTTITTRTYNDIIITYSATVNENAVLGSEGNTNTATLTYSNDPNYTSDGSKTDLPDEPDPDENVPTGKTPEETTYTYVAGIQLTKVDGVDDTKTLTGAEFTITGEKVDTVLVTGIAYVEDKDGTYYQLTDGSYTQTAPSTEVGADNSAYVSTETKYIQQTYTKYEQDTTGADANVVTATGIVDSNGVLEFDGLAADTYLIEEITAPDGYNLLSQPILVIISWTAPTDTKTSTDCTWSAVSYLEWSEDNGVYTYDANDKIELGVTVDNGTGIVVGILTLDVANNSGTILPSTGGMGTTLFYVIGGLLMFIAAVLLITKSRMRKSE